MPPEDPRLIEIATVSRRMDPARGLGGAIFALVAGTASILTGCTEVIGMLWPTSAPVVVPDSLTATYQGNGVVAIACEKKVVVGKVWGDEYVSFNACDPASGSFDGNYDNGRPRQSIPLGLDGKFAPFTMGAPSSPIGTRDVVMARVWVKGFGAPYFAEWATLSIR